METISIGRQPVFDDKGRLWGYELFSVGGPETTSVAVGIESSAYVSLEQIIGNRKKIIVDFTGKSILDQMPHALPPSLTAIKINQHAGLQDQVMETLERLKAEGYLIAVAGFTADPACEPLYRLADILAIDAAAMGRAALSTHVAAARMFGSSVLADRVPDRAVYAICKELGFSLFHGAFFKSPEKLTVRQLSSNETLRLELLKEIQQEQPDLIRLSNAIQADATISFRLLAYLNSASFAFTQRIGSIRQAIALLGWTKVKDWLAVVLLSDVGQSRDAHELVLISSQRGMFLKLVAQDHDFWGFDPEALHLLGIFSLLDALLLVPMKEIVSHLPIENKMKTALLNEPNNEYSPLLRLTQSLEEARWEEAEALIRQLNLDRARVVASFRASIDWASTLVSVQATGGQ